MKLNLGCGSQIVDGWINVDYALGARVMKIPFARRVIRTLKLFNLDWDKSIYIHNLAKRLPWADSTASVVYSSHILEHFDKEDGLRFIEECHRVLRANGIIRIVVPDLRHVINEYLEGNTRADDFIEQLGVLCGRSSNALRNRLYPLFRFPHKCMYDTSRLLGILDDTGFNVVVKAAFDSDIKDIKMIELEERTDNAVIVEGRKR